MEILYLGNTVWSQYYFPLLRLKVKTYGRVPLNGFRKHFIKPSSENLASASLTKVPPLKRGVSLRPCCFLTYLISFGIMCFVMSFLCSRYAFVMLSLCFSLFFHHVFLSMKIFLTLSNDQFIFVIFSD